MEGETIYCLDTDVLIDYFNGNAEAKKAIDNITTSLIYVTEITVFELGYGIFCARKKKDFDQFIRFLERVQIIPTMTMFALDAAAFGGELKKKGITIGPMDLLIAGMMLNFGVSKLITRNKKHFEAIKGIEVISY